MASFQDKIGWKMPRNKKKSKFHFRNQYAITIFINLNK